MKSFGKGLLKEFGCMAMHSVGNGLWGGKWDE